MSGAVLDSGEISVNITNKNPSCEGYIPVRERDNKQGKWATYVVAW